MMMPVMTEESWVSKGCPANNLSYLDNTSVLQDRGCSKPRDEVPKPVWECSRGWEKVAQKRKL